MKCQILTAAVSITSCIQQLFVSQTCMYNDMAITFWLPPVIYPYQKDVKYPIQLMEGHIGPSKSWFDVLKLLDGKFNHEVTQKFICNHYVKGFNATLHQMQPPDTKNIILTDYREPFRYEMPGSVYFQIIAETINMLQHHVSVILNYSGEWAGEDNVDSIQLFASRYKIDLSRMLFLHFNMYPSDNGFVSMFQGKQIKEMFWNMYMANIHSLSSGLQCGRSRSGSYLRDALILGGNPRMHKGLKLLKLYTMNELRGVTFSSGVYPFCSGAHTCNPGSLYCDLLENKTLVSHFCSQLPKKLDVLIDSNMNHRKANDDKEALRHTVQLYQKARFTLVLETDTRQGRQFAFVTEKVLYPIMSEVPFLYAGSMNGLRALRLLGFRTFSPFFNESYDGIAEPRSRMDAVSSEFARLSALQSPEFDTSVGDQVRHNCEHFTGMSFKKTLVRLALEVLDASVSAASS